MATSLTLFMDDELLAQRNLPPVAACDHLESILTPYLGGNCIVRVVFSCSTAKSLLVFSEQWSVVPKEAMLKQLEKFSTRHPEGLIVGYASRPVASQNVMQQA